MAARGDKNVNKGKVPLVDARVGALEEQVAGMIQAAKEQQKLERQQKIHRYSMNIPRPNHTLRTIFRGSEPTKTIAVMARGDDSLMLTAYIEKGSREFGFQGGQGGRKLQEFAFVPAGGVARMSVVGDLSRCGVGRIRVVYARSTIRGPLTPEQVSDYWKFHLEDIEKDLKVFSVDLETED